jgi:TonB family protein
MEVESAPDRSRTKSKHEETIEIDDSLYQRKGDGPWRKIDLNRMTSDISKFGHTDPDGGDMMKGVKEVILKGEETLDGIPVLAYQLVMRDASGKGQASASKIWIGVNDGLPHRIENEFEVKPGDLGVPGLNPDKIKVIYTLYDFNAEIIIEPPAKYISYPKANEPRIEPPQTGPGAGGGIGVDARLRDANPRVGPGTERPVTPIIVDTKPVLLYSPRPIYTKEARDNKIQGVIRARVLVGVDGSVQQVRLTSHLPDGLDEQGVAVARKMKFKPAMKDGQPVAYWFPIEIEFNLR